MTTEPLPTVEIVVNGHSMATLSRQQVSHLANYLGHQPPALRFARTGGRVDLSPGEYEVLEMTVARELRTLEGTRQAHARKRTRERAGEHEKAYQVASRLQFALVG